MMNTLNGMVATQYGFAVPDRVWTRHGFAIPNKNTDGVERPPVMRCGGIKWCDECKADVEAAQ